MNLAHSRLTVVALLVASLAVAPAAAEGAKKKPKPCSRKGSTTVAASSKLRIYEVGGYDRTVFGCLRSTNKRMIVARYSSCDCSTSDEPQPTIWLNRETVAANEYGCPPPGAGDECSGIVASFDVRRRVKRYAEVVPGGIVDNLVLKPNGSFAYIAADTVRKADSAGVGQLDAGPGVEEGSLARAGSIVYWTKAGQAFSTRLQ
jgi:hypothetical protein